MGDDSYDDCSDNSSEESLQPEDIVDLFIHVKTDTNDPFFLCNLSSTHLTIFLESLDTREPKRYNNFFINEFNVDINRSLNIMYEFIKSKDLDDTNLLVNWYNLCYKYSDVSHFYDILV
jgi:hypothetical protein